MNRKRGTLLDQRKEGGGNMASTRKGLGSNKIKRQNTTHKGVVESGDGYGVSR